jgi:SAM-dependent methyltransferase
MLEHKAPEPIITSIKFHTKALAKKGVESLLRHFGFQLSRIPNFYRKGSDIYFNTGKLTPVEENSVDLYNQFYSDECALAEYYDASRLRFYEMVSEELRKQGLNLNGKDIIDVGCGTGHLLSELAKMASPSTLSGCDFSEAGMRYSRIKFPRSRFFVHDINYKLPGTYDFVFCTEVLEHLQHPHVAIKNLLYALREGGMAVITVPNGRLDTINEHINFWSPESWPLFLERECDGCGVNTYVINDNMNNIAFIVKL